MTTIEPISTKKRPAFIVSIDVRTIYDRLLKANVGDIVPYEELEALIGRSVRDKGAWILASARHRAFTQNNLLFGIVTKVGVKRLSDAEIVGTATDSLTRIHRMSLRAAHRVSAVQNFDALPSESKVKFNSSVSALALLEHLTKESQLKKIEAKVQASSKSLPLQKTLEAFRE